MSSQTASRLKLGRIAATIAVTDIQAAARIYQSVFGLEKVFENGNPVGFMILRKDDGELHLTRQKGYRGPPFNVAHILVSDAQIAHDNCVAQGLRIIKGLQSKEYGLRSFVFADPDGNRIDVGEPL